MEVSVLVGCDSCLNCAEVVSFAPVDWFPHSSWWFWSKAISAVSQDKHDSWETAHDRNLRRQLSSSDESGALTKKVEGGHVTLAQLAEEWLLSSYKILQIPYSREAYIKALKEAEFL
ncbi:hypothetical protein LOK49_Contig61G00001 [Camellia lanceoleosa]|nr:hypothetical protein LOK49_Contig61G00001 [Camellia lanceoleosa]